MPPVLPSGQSLDGDARERLRRLQALVLRASYRLMSIQRAIEGSDDREYVRARILEALDIVDGLHRLEDGTATGSLAAWARESIPATYGGGVRRGLADLAGQAMSPVTGDRRIHMAAVESLLGNVDRRIARDLVVPLYESAIRTARVAIDSADFASDLAAGIMGGLPRTETSRLLRQSVLRAVNESVPGGRPNLADVQVGGRTMSLETWSEVFARTELARASTTGTRTSSAVNGVLHVQITSHAHAPCICTPFEGRIYRIYEDQGDTRFDWIGDVPGGGCPMHPNCVHREAPAVVEFLEERGDVAGRERPAEAFRGMDERELARAVRQNADALRRWSEDRDGYLPGGFQMRRAA
jgi:hypothetical protein